MSVYEGYNSVVAATGEDLDGILAKVKVATPATASGPGGACKFDLGGVSYGPMRQHHRARI